MTIFPSNDEEDIITNDEEELVSFNKEEISALLHECMHSYISYENPIARQVITKMYLFIGEPQRRT